MIRDIKDVRAFYQKSLGTVSAKNVLRSIQKLNEVLKEAKVKGASDDYLYRLGEQGKSAIINDYYISKNEEKEVYKNQLEQLKNKYIKGFEKNWQLFEFRQRQFERKLKVMTDDEVRKLGMDFIEDRVNYDDPAQVDILFAEIKTRAIDETKGLEGLQIAARRKNYDSPWLNTEDAIILNRKINALNISDIGLLTEEDGKPFGLGFNDMFDAFDTSKDEEDGNE